MGKRKLTKDQIRAIKADRRTYKAIAEEYGIAESYVGLIKRGERPRADLDLANEPGYIDYRRTPNHKRIT